MLTPGESYENLCASFSWNIPAFFNMGVAACDRHAGQRYRLALIYEAEDGRVEKYTFWNLRRLSNQFANALLCRGFKRGDRLAILLPQCPETGIAHLAAYKTGGIGLPLFTLFGPDALQYRLQNSEARCVITDGDNLEKVLQIKDSLPHLQSIFVTRGRHTSEGIDFRDALDGESTDYQPVKTRSEDPALLAYTSGTTGPPKGALHAHRTLIGHMPGVEFPHNFFPKEDDLFWTPADWAWLGGLTDVLLPSWFHGIPVLACRQKKFDPEFAFHLMAKHGVRNTFLPPTALKLMRQVKNPADRYDFDLRSVGSGGETLGEELLEWGRENLGLTINEFYGQTEVNLVVSNCVEVMKIVPGSMGKAVPGHSVEIIDDQGTVLPTGETGIIAIRRPDPVMLLEYWRNPEATEKKFIGDWWVTGDIGRKDEEGYLWFVGRDDDLITSSGYRIGPGEIEDCLIKHPAVGMAAVIGVPDEVRTEIIKAFIVLSPGVDPDPALEAEIRNFIKQRLAAHEYPREIEFVGELPLTATGKIIRKDLREKEIEKINKGSP
ncbi:MAG: AMP-dependent synthetase [Deltaproteobacteria bacterium SG8_13]|nr:MAG: AMP-dependent synthetase [Deltaproteobacteria bacterium SG8_13]